MMGQICCQNRERKSDEHESHGISHLDKKLMRSLKRYRKNLDDKPAHERIINFDQCLMKVNTVKKTLITIRRLASTFDEDDDDTIDQDELRKAFDQLGLTGRSEQDVHELFHGLQSWDKKTLKKEDAFLVCLITAYILGDMEISTPKMNIPTSVSSDPQNTKTALRDAFNVIIGAYMLFDPDLSGRFTKYRMDLAMQGDSSKRWAEMDDDENEKICFSEFVVTFGGWFVDEDD